MPIDIKVAPIEQLQRILELRQQIEALQSELDRLEHGKAAPVAAKAPKQAGGQAKRNISPEARQKMAEAARKGWAVKRKGAKATAPAKAPAAKKKKASPKMLAALARARAAKAEKAKTTPATA